MFESERRKKIEAKRWQVGGVWGELLECVIGGGGVAAGELESE